MVLENVETPEDLEAAVKGWAEEVRDTVLTLPLAMQGKHYAAIDGVLNDLKRDYGLVVEIEGIQHPGPIANSLHVDGDLLARRAEDYVPEGREIDRKTLSTAVEMFTAGAESKGDIRALAGDDIGVDRLGDLTEALGAVARANEDYSYAARPGAVAGFWRRFGALSENAGIDRQFAKGVFENDLLTDAQKPGVLSAAVDPARGPKILAEQMFEEVQGARSEMRANIMTPDSAYLAFFMQRLTEREYPSAAPEFANRESEREYAAALRAEFGAKGLERMAGGDYRDLAAITPNRLHQRELAASVMAMAERPEHAEKLGLTRAQIAQGYEAADEPRKARRVLGLDSAGDEFSL